MNTPIKLIGALLATGLISASALAAESTTTTGTTTTTTGTTTTGTTTTGTTTTTTGTAPALKPTALKDTGRCSGGGTRTLTGSWDTTSGAIDTTTTLKDCVLRNGDVHNGTTTLAGTLLASKTGFTIDVTGKVDTSVVRKDGSTLARKCTTTKKGSFTNTTQIFDGTTTRTDCSLTGQNREHEGLAEHLLRNSITDDDDGGAERTKRLRPAEEDTDKDDDDDKKPTVSTPTKK